MTTTPAPVSARKGPRPTGTTGQVLQIVGAKLSIAALLLPIGWYGGLSYDDIGDTLADAYHRDVTALWFSGLAFVGVALAVFAGLGATIPSRFTRMFQALGVLLVSASTALTVLMTTRLEDVTGGFGPALYLALAGHLVLFAGVVVGPWRKDGYRGPEQEWTDEEIAREKGWARGLAGL
ncbi:hypothetical protein [Jatrophihabitans fulvus]